MFWGRRLKSRQLLWGRKVHPRQNPGYDYELKYSDGAVPVFVMLISAYSRYEPKTFGRRSFSDAWRFIYSRPSARLARTISVFSPSVEWFIVDYTVQNALMVCVDIVHDISRHLQLLHDGWPASIATKRLWDISLDLGSDAVARRIPTGLACDCLLHYSIVMAMSPVIQ